MKNPFKLPSFPGQHWHQSLCSGPKFLDVCTLKPPSYSLLDILFELGAGIGAAVVVLPLSLSSNRDVVLCGGCQLNVGRWGLPTPTSPTAAGWGGDGGRDSRLTKPNQKTEVRQR